MSGELISIDFDDHSNLVITRRFGSVQAGGTHYNHFDFNVHLCIDYIACPNRRAVPQL